MSNKYPTYVDEEVLNATPLKFVQMLYRGALDSIAAARRYLRLGDIRARSLAISKAMRIITELSLALNHEAGGELSKNLAQLYHYAETLLIKANSEQCDRRSRKRNVCSALFQRHGKSVHKKPRLPSATRRRRNTCLAPTSAHSLK